MSTIHFYGHVHPTNIPVSINELTTHVEHPQEGKATFTIRIQDSTVHVTCIDHDSSYTSQRGQILFFRAMHLTQAAVDLAGFVSGAGFQIIFEEAAIDDQPRGWIEHRQPNLAALCSVISTHAVDKFKTAGDASFNDVFFALCDSPELLFALHDLNLALTHKVQQPTHCARTIEGLRNYFGAEEKTKVAWERMRENLNLTQPYIQFITDQSRGPRHGSLLDVSSADSRTTLERTWIIVNRFLEFRKRGDKKLPLTEFPLL
jgi:hypothetical protein